MKRIVVLGASNKPERYSNKAIKMLQQHKFAVIPVNPYATQIEGLPVAKTLGEVQQPVHAVTIYLNAKQSLGLKEVLIQLKPNHAIFNPGAESAELTKALTAAGIHCQNSCTLVLLSTGQFPQ